MQLELGDNYSWVTLEYVTNETRFGPKLGVGIWTFAYFDGCLLHYAIVSIIYYLDIAEYLNFLSVTRTNGKMHLTE